MEKQANIILRPDILTPIRTADSRLVSYNIEMTEVTGGTFWKAYTPDQIAGTEEFQGTKVVKDFLYGGTDAILSAC